MDIPPARKAQQFRAGTLALQLDSDDETVTLLVRGELDLANAEMLDTELTKAFSDSERQVVVDMRELTFIDSTGIAILVAAMKRNGDGDRLRFRPSKAPAVTRVLKLTGVEQRLPLLETKPSDEPAPAGP